MSRGSAVGASKARRLTAVAAADMAAMEDDADTWIGWFCSQKGNEFLCEVEASFIEDAFNLYGLRSMVPHFRDCIEMILDIRSGSERDREDWSGALFEHARDLYGLIHARFILTSRGMLKMLHKYEDLEFGHCPNVACQNFPVLPVGLSNDLRVETVKLFCPRCEQVYRATTHDAPSSLDGSFFGTTFPHLLLLLRPGLAPPKSPWRYVPRIYGFRIYGRAGSKGAGVLEAIAEQERKGEDVARASTALIEAIAATAAAAAAAAAAATGTAASSWTAAASAPAAEQLNHNGAEAGAPAAGAGDGDDDDAEDEAARHAPKKLKTSA
ncbi:hypothetical protein FNF29_08075 [Cafeteria roenbergensis]|uniref:Casein kinase II subunit beta n=1 Tax=Cafeteria roenbergensis TaxID=33653 RepID=A0A5A8C1F6_CAFRO|nr:hypothetical protein FNF29_08075 [Cafeteria roenbergensis]|eukprot:KAA0146389.1 hypothetical protein FNF29_08075 [Cafeteria roenbergensis]